MRYIILGMHKSGTTLMAHMLHSSGINMIDNIVPLSYDQGSKYERMNFVLANLALLDIHPSKLSYETIEYRSSPKALKELITFHVEHLINKNDKAYKNWGFKDPRTCLTYEFWNTKLGKHKLIGVYRSPLEVIEHYISKYRFGAFRPVLIFKIFKAWFVYNSAILRAVAAKEAILVSYRWLLSDPDAIDKLSQKLSHPLVDLRNQNLKRSKKKKSLISSAIIFILKFGFGMDINKLNSELNRKQTFDFIK